MLKLKKFKEKKLTNKNIMISFAIMMVFMLTIIISKSYAIYKLEKKYDLIQSKIGTFTNGDVKVAVLVDGKEASEFPSYETNYKIESVECTNGVTGSFDVENWQVTIADMSATSTKCTVSFNSKETNEVTPINMSKKELMNLVTEYENTTFDKIKPQVLNYLYPVGSIYMSTTDDTVEKVIEKFGGTWVKYSSGTTLVGDDGTNYITNDASKGSGGSKTVTLTTANLPSHNHSFTPSGNITASFSGNRTTTETSGNHNHTVYGIQSSGTSNVRLAVQTDGNIVAYNSSNSVLWNLATSGSGSTYRSVVIGQDGITSTNGSHSHAFTPSGTVSAKFNGSSSTTGSTGSGAAFSVQNPYTVVYMYKRTA